jgi:DNA-binding IclR family transcriptional regulator
MNRNAAALLAPLSEEVSSVLAVLVAGGPDTGFKLNDLSQATSLPTGHIGRHLRTLERDRLAQYGAGGAWHPTLRGMRHPLHQPADHAPIAA